MAADLLRAVGRWLALVLPHLHQHDRSPGAILASGWVLTFVLLLHMQPQQQPFGLLSLHVLGPGQGMMRSDQKLCSSRKPPPPPSVIHLGRLLPLPPTGQLPGTRSGLERVMQYGGK